VWGGLKVWAIKFLPTFRIKYSVRSEKKGKLVLPRTTRVLFIKGASSFVTNTCRRIRPTRISIVVVKNACAHRVSWDRLPVRLSTFVCRCVTDRLIYLYCSSLLKIAKEWSQSCRNIVASKPHPLHHRTTLQCSCYSIPVSTDNSLASILVPKHTLAYKTRMLMDYIHRPVISIDHDVSETGSVSVLRWIQRSKPYSVGSSRKS
jgi:hypothetical protein